MISRLIQLTLTVLFSSLLSIGTADAYDKLYNPCQATKTLLKNLMGENWNTAAAATVFVETKYSHSVKQVLDAKGIFVDYGKLPSTPDYVNESGNPSVLLDARLPEIELERVDDGPYAGQWQVSELSKDNIHVLYSETFSGYVSAFLDVLPATFLKPSLDCSVAVFALSHHTVSVSWLAGRLVDRVIYNQFLAFIEKQTFSLDPRKCCLYATPSFGWSSLCCLWLVCLTYNSLCESAVGYFHCQTHHVLFSSDLLL